MWRYQPVFYEFDGSTVFGLCEVYFDDDRQLKNWTEARYIEPSGESLHELTQDLTHMLVDAYRWVPVPYSALKVDSTFERAISPEQAEALAQMVQAMTHNLAEARSVTDPPERDT